MNSSEIPALTAFGRDTYIRYRGEIEPEALIQESLYFNLQNYDFVAWLSSAIGSPRQT